MKILKVILISFFSSVVHAEKIQYFESKIDFWGDKATSKGVLIEPNKQIEKSDDKFPWKTYLDPKNKEFFKEGDYTPPEPFMEVARNPTDENIKQWLDLMKKKNELQATLQTRMQEYMAKNNLVQVQQTVTNEKSLKINLDTSVDPSRFKLRMYFESTCPHCKRMFQVLKKLQNDGFQIEALQVDRGPVQESEKVLPILQADPEDLKKHGIKGVPFLLIADSKKKILLPPIEGYHDQEEILRLLKAASRI